MRKFSVVLFTAILTYCCCSCKKELSADNAIVSKEDGIVDGHGWVDLGLSVKWATCNVGAEKPEEYGEYFAYGETVPKAYYSRENCAAWDDSSIRNIQGTELDAATVNWGSKWRMPTKDEFQELIDNCDWSAAELNGVVGYRFVGKNGKSLFFPAGGFYDNDVTDGVEYNGSSGYYWCGSRSWNANAYYLNFFMSSDLFTYVSEMFCYSGCSIRAITE